MCRRCAAALRALRQAAAESPRARQPNSQPEAVCPPQLQDTVRLEAVRPSSVSGPSADAKPAQSRTVANVSSATASRTRIGILLR